MTQRGWTIHRLAGALAGAALLLSVSGCSSPSPSATSSDGASGSLAPSATPQASPTATSSPTLSELARLSIVPVAGLVAGDELLAFASTDIGLVGVGQRGDQGAVWTSRDGVEWTLVPDLPTEESGEFALTRLTSVADGPAGLVVIGAWSTIDFSTPRVWYSADRQHWASVYGPSDASLGEFASMNAVAYYGMPEASGYLTVGFVSDDGYTSRPQVWESADGRDWTAADVPPLSGMLNDVSVSGDVLVAVGGSEGGALVLVSTDGATWTPAPEQEALRGAEMTSVTAFDGGYGSTFVATGWLTHAERPLPGTPAIWHSPDGLHWTLGLRGEPGQEIRQAIAIGAGFVAIGGQFPSASWSYDPAAPNPPSDAIELWFSTDGETWSGPTMGFTADGGIRLGRATVDAGLAVPIALLNAGPAGPVTAPAILRGLLWAVG